MNTSNLHTPVTIKQINKRILYLESCEWDCQRFQEALTVLEQAAEKLLDLGYQGTMLDYAMVGQ